MRTSLCHRVHKQYLKCFFLNEPHKIVRVSIDIAEEYKITILGDHRQKKKKKQNNIDTPGWIGTSTRGTPQLDSPEKRHSSTLTRLDWGINTGKHSKLQSHGGRVSQVATTTNLLLPRKSPSKHDPASIRSREKQTAPRREGHR